MTNDERIFPEFQAILAGRDAQHAMKATPLIKEITRRTGIDGRDVMDVLKRIATTWPATETRYEVHGLTKQMANLRYWWAAPAGWKPGDNPVPSSAKNILLDTMIRIEHKLDRLLAHVEDTEEDIPARAPSASETVEEEPWVGPKDLNNLTPFEAETIAVIDAIKFGVTDPEYWKEKRRKVFEGES